MFCRSHVLFTGLCLSFGQGVHAVISLDASTASFASVPLGAPSDPFVDEQSQGKGLDLVGGVGGFDAFYLAYNPGASSTEGEFVFRSRLGGSKNGQFSAFLNIGLDIDGGGLDYFIQFSGKNPDTIRLLRATGTTANNSALGAELRTDLAQEVEYLNASGSNASTANASFTEVSNVVDVAPEPGFAGDVTDIDNNDGSDYFLTFSFDFNHLVEVVRADAQPGGTLDSSFQLFDDSFAFAMLVTTSQNANNINGDFGGIDGNTPGSGDVPFVDTGNGTPPGPGLSTPFLPEEETFVPEPSAYALLAGLLALAWVSVLRRRHA